ncbi:DUF3558 domain-containing protein [Streptomyces sp. AK02-01A]|uniref:DUF3558 domain-containing protein n=1 Tax=Streptomyces sp. AK02-01A TaxID=3028648 RepID=UPI0029A76724|nr:DUF3558 domain-containing protein [Streptomyces sp. AK02-01A]MDX3851091.1 DUF3558 domain-containing protein [Streptomyces sp. AK02-01A]
MVVAGCSSGADRPALDAKPGGPTTSAAPPGKYRTLREPCGSVPRSTLKALLPGVAALPEDQRDKVYDGTASVTYDTDRRVGCSWKADSPDASHQLVIDLERVVSYDPGVSDDDRAQAVYLEKETAAALPVPGDSGASSQPPSSPASGTGAGADTTTRSGPGSETSAPPSETPSAEGLEPRLLDGLGDVAFLNDVLARSGSAAQHRTVSVVFRTSNVIVTVRYSEQPALPAEVPDSKELQEKARQLARTLADQLNE